MPPPPPYQNSKTNPDLPTPTARTLWVTARDDFRCRGDTGQKRRNSAYLLEDDEARTDDDTFAPAAITQPRRLLLRRIATVAEELPVTLGGDEVGYKVPSDSVAQRATKLT